MIKYLLFLCLVVLTLSCTRKVSTSRYSLEKTNKVLAFPVIDEVKMPQFSVFLFNENGEDYLSYQNLPKNEILIYNTSVNFYRKIKS